MTRKELSDIIKNELKTLAYDTLRNSSQRINEKEVSKPKKITEEELEKILFYGGGEPEEKNPFKYNPINIKESVENGIPKIQASEVKEFEDSFELMLSDIEGASVVFDTQSNGYPLKIWIGSEGIEAGSSGLIDMGLNGKVSWSYSLKNGLNIKTENLNIDKGNKNFLEKIYHHYNNWQKEWRQKLTITPAEQETNLNIEQPPQDIQNTQPNQPIQ